MSTNRTRYTEAEWAFFESQIRGGRVIKDARKAMKALYGRAPSGQACWRHLNARGIPYSGRQFAASYKRSAVAKARTGNYRTLDMLRMSLPADIHGRQPCNESLRLWLLEAGVALETMESSGGAHNRHDPQTKARALELMLDGYSAPLVVHILAFKGVDRLPAPSTVLSWSMEAGIRQIRRDAGLRLVYTRRNTSLEELIPPFLVQDWEADEARTARLIRRDGCMLAKRRAARGQARRVAA